MTFFKTFLAAVLAFIVANVLLSIMMIMFFASLTVFMSEPVPSVEKGSILYLDISEGITDSPGNSPFTYSGLYGLTFDRSNTILQAVTAIEQAASDDNILGVYISLKGGGVSLANLEELRNALQEFRQTGKFVISYADYYTQADYYLSSVADMLFINPRGEVLWKGISSNVTFYKGLLDKLGVEPEIVRHGSYKAAVEPFMYEQMSPENREQLSVMLNTVWGAILRDVSMSRGIDSVVLSNYATELSVRSAEHAVQYGFADGALYEDQVMEILGRLSTGSCTPQQAFSAVTGISEDSGFGEPSGLAAENEIQEEEFPRDVTDMENVEQGPDDYEQVYTDPQFITLGNYIASSQGSGSRHTSQNKVALIYADGDIVDGESTEVSVGGATLAAKLAQVRKDDEVKAVVLRVNSPGGSALASEVIWREMELVRQIKPLVVSMGSVAASGGYYISCPADAILAGHTTLTGSIGVFGLMVDISKAMKEKLGITVDVVKTNPSGDFGSFFRPLSPNERDVLMYGIEQVYSTFVGHVADGRNMSEVAVDDIGGGRVWSGASAMQIGLVDGWGGIKDAITLAAERAGIGSDFAIWQVVEDPDSLTALLQSLGYIRTVVMKDELAEMFVYYTSLKNILSGHKIQVRMPYMLDIQ